MQVLGYLFHNVSYAICFLTHYQTIPHFDTLKIYSCGEQGFFLLVGKMIPGRQVGGKWINISENLLLDI